MKKVFGFIFVLLLLPSLAFGAEGQKLKVAISPFAPFVLNASPAEAQGYSIDLWEAIAKEEGWEYEFVQKEGVKAKLQALEQGEVDLAIGGISVTEQREEKFDFSHPTYRGGLDILTKASKSLSYLDAFAQLFTARKKIILLYFGVIIVGAFVIWFVERGKDNFNDNFMIGYEEALYFAVTTSTTVGYGDYHPGKKWGRRMAMLLMLVSLPVFALLNAELTAIITVDSIQADVSGPGDLAGKRVGVVDGTTADQWATNLKLNVVRYKNLDLGAKDVELGVIDAFIYDQPTLVYYQQTHSAQKLVVVGKLFFEQALGMAFPSKSDMVEKVNRTLLKLQENGKAEEIRRKWFEST